MASCEKLPAEKLGKRETVGRRFGGIFKSMDISTDVLKFLSNTHRDRGKMVIIHVIY